MTGSWFRPVGHEEEDGRLSHLPDPRQEEADEGKVVALEPGPARLTQSSLPVVRSATGCFRANGRRAEINLDGDVISFLKESEPHLSHLQREKEKETRGQRCSKHESRICKDQNVKNGLPLTSNSGRRAASEFYRVGVGWGGRRVGGGGGDVDIPPMLLR